MSMVFCDKCDRHIQSKISPSGDNIIFECVCTHIMPTRPDSYLLWESGSAASDVVELNSKFIANSAFDPTNVKEKKECPKCHLNFMTRLQLGEDAITIYTCTCGI